ncbi:MAG: dTDP-4-dehydrorhamnose reductase, partial [Nitrospinota bacterium]
LLSSLEPDVVILAAAYTKVDDSETNKKTAFKVNGEGAGNVAAGCFDARAKLIFVSTDYVFNGEKEKYVENDTPSPLNVYGESKLFGEEQVKKELNEHCIVRTSWLFGEHGPNFVKSILRAAGSKKELTVVDDQKGAPTYTPDLASAIFHLLSKGVTGTVHVSNGGECTWFGFAKEILKIYQVSDVRVSPMKSSEFGSPATRPSSSVLDCSRYEALTGQKMRPWKDALTAYREGNP